MLTAISKLSNGQMIPLAPEQTVSSLNIKIIANQILSDN